MAEGKTTATKTKSPDLIEEAVKRGVEAFLDAHLRNSDFSRDTPAWNHFQAGLPVLIESITKEVKGL